MSWPELENVLSDVVDDTFGEAFEFRPMARANVNVGSKADPGRTATRCRGVFGDRAYTLPELGKVGNPPRHQAGPMLSLTNPMLSIDMRQLADPIRAGDRFKRIATGDVYEVSDVQPDGQGRKRLELTCAGSE